MKIIRLKNNTNVADYWIGVQIQPGEYYQLQNDTDLNLAINSQKVNSDLWSGDLVINNGTIDLSSADGDKWFKSSGIQEVQSVTPKNEHTLLPDGMIKGYINKNGKMLNITLSDKSGVVYTISGGTPTLGAYVCQEGFTKRAEIEEINGNSITLSNSLLSNGSAIYCVPSIIDFKLPEIEGNTYEMDILNIDLPLKCLNLWGLMFDCCNSDNNDFLELSIICEDGIPNVIEPGTKIKDYDYSWVKNLKKLGELFTPDRTPGIIPETWVIRVTYFCTEIFVVDSYIDIYLDYMITKKD